jgi:hypothetical protein
VVLLPADNAVDCELSEEIISTFIALGCIEFCCVGAFSEQMHDQIDIIIERSENIEIATTWFDHNNDACEYFLFAAGAGKSSLLALVLDKPELLNVLKEIAKKA